MSYHKRKFCIQIFDVKKLIDLLIKNGFSIQCCEDNHYYQEPNKPFVVYQQDLAQIAEFEEVDENALFYQILFEKGESFNSKRIIKNIIEKNPLYFGVKEDQLVVPIPELIYLDFINIDFTKLNYVRYIEAIFNNGLSYRDAVGCVEDRYKYWPFDKSASMGRHRRISFISDSGYTYRNSKINDFRERIKDRCHLGLDALLNGGNLAKRYAYRGLLMSGGYRVDNYFLDTKGGIHLDKSTVLIVPDQIADSFKASYFTQEALPKEQQPERKEGEIHSFVMFKDTAVHIQDAEKSGANLNDGFGLISERFANKIDEILSFRRKHTSFQIRLPYVKGLVHVVNFAEFLKEHRDENGNILIRHFDGHLKEVIEPFSEEQVDKLELVITESMFKCIKELAKFQKENSDQIPDAIEYYWNKFHEYNHSLFVLSMDQKEKEMTSLNFQFLSTADLSIEAFKKLYEQSQKAYTSLLFDDEVRLAHLLGDDIENIDEDSEDIDERYFDAEKELLLLNKKAFINEPHYVSRLDSEADALSKSISTGSLIIKGQDRYLAGDILSFLYWLAGQKMPAELAISYEKEDSFVAPGIDEYGVLDKQRCAVLRNPHLSRNEDLTLCCYIPEKDSERNKYGLSNLTGVCMIDPTDKSLPADTVGGADYDGDHVKIIIDDNYANALHKNQQDPLVINDEHKKLFEEQGNSQDDTLLNQLRTNLSTFDNNVGIISNLALMEAMKAYNTKTLESEEEVLAHENRVRLLGIMTGLETDSAKTGIKPYYLDLQKYIRSNACIKENGQKKKNVNRYFIDFKSYIVNGSDKYKYDFKDDHFDFLFSAQEDLEKFSSEFFEKYGRNPNSIELLIPSYYVFKKQKKEALSREQDKLILKNYPVDVKDGLDERKVAIIINWVNAYKQVKNEINFANKSKNISELNKSLKAQRNLDDFYRKNPDCFDVCQKLLGNLFTYSLKHEAEFNNLYNDFVLGNPIHYFIAAAEMDRGYFYKTFSGEVVDEEIIDFLLDHDEFIEDALKLALELKNQSKPKVLDVPDAYMIRNTYFNVYLNDETGKPDEEMCVAKFEELSDYLNDSFADYFTMFEERMNNELKAALKKKHKKGSSYKDIIKDSFQRFLNHEGENYGQKSLKEQAETSAYYCIEALKNKFYLVEDKDENEIKLTINPIKERLERCYQQYSAESIIRRVYGSDFDTLSNEMITKVNNYRYSLIKKHSPNYYELKKLSINCQQDKKRCILLETKKRLSAAFDDEKEIIKYLRALQSEIDSNQSFLFDAYLPEFIDVAKEELSND